MKSREPATSSPVLLYLVTEDWYFLSHRLPMAQAAQRAGYQIHVATSVNNGGARIEAEGFRLHPLSWRRGSFNPINLIRTVLQVRSLYRRLKPDLVHHVALQSAVVGSVAALGLPVAQLNALGGLGSTYTSQTAKAIAIRPLLRLVLSWLFNGPHKAVLVQNLDDRRVVEAIGVNPARIFLIPGSGVDVGALTPLPEPPGTITVAFVGRLLEDKGLRSLVAAHEILIAKGLELRLLIAGEPDPANPASIPRSETASWQRTKGIELAGQVEDIRKVWAAAHIAVLPSRREGLPKSLLEAAACGRPIVATDVPGCREIARAGVNALLVPPDKPAALAAAIERLVNDRDLRLRYGAAGRRLVEEQFSSERIGRETVALYGSLLGRLRS